MSHPETVYWLEVHLRLIKGDSGAEQEIVKHFLSWLSKKLSHRRPDVDTDLAFESAENALFNYRSNPHRFDVTRGVCLGYWLLLQARGHLSRLLRKERSRQAREQTIGIHDKEFAKIAESLSRKRQSGGYLLVEEENPPYCTEDQRRILAKFSSREQDEFVLLKRKAKQEEWVGMLGLDGLPEAEQQKQIGKEKERIRKKRQRMLKEWHERNGERTRQKDSL